MHRISVLQVLLLCCGSFFSQNSVYDNLTKLSDKAKETAKTFIPSKLMLPCDFSSYFSDAYVGISDARLDSATAYNQAFLRALSVFALQNAKGRGMSDFFNDSSTGSTSSNYEEFCELKAECELPSSAVKVMKTQRLKSGELILKLKIDSLDKNQNPDDNIHFMTSVELYNKETEINKNSTTATKLLIKNTAISTGDPKSHSETLTCFLSNNRWVSQESVLDSIKIDNSRYKWLYLMDNDCKNDTTGFEDKAFGTTDGLWFAVANGIYGSLSAQLKPQFLKLKLVDDSYENKLLSLNRESGFFRFSTTILGGIYVENKLYTKIKTSFQ
ncbi:MAG: hypothetical protein WCK78_01120 [Paludibacter sp.]